MEVDPLNFCTNEAVTLAHVVCTETLGLGQCTQATFIAFYGVLKYGYSPQLELTVSTKTKYAYKVSEIGPIIHAQISSSL